MQANKGFLYKFNIVNNFIKLKSIGNRIALVTANFSGIDDIKPLTSCDRIDSFYYTDEITADTASSESKKTWTRVIDPNYPRHDFNHRLRRRYFKHQIHRLDEVSDHRWLVWADSSLHFNSLNFLVEKAATLSRLPVHQRVLLIPHPDRPSIWDEYQYIQSEIDMGNQYLDLRYKQEKMPEKMEYFRAKGWNMASKLWCGTIWMIENSEPIRRAWDMWWDQNLRFGMMDQLSLPVVLANHGIEPQALDIVLWKNELFTYVPHSKNM